MFQQIITSKNIIKGINFSSIKEKTETLLIQEQENKIKLFIEKNSNLDDSDFHKFAEKLGINKHEAEEVVYKLLNQNLNIKGGKSDNYPTLKSIADLWAKKGEGLPTMFLKELEKQFEIGIKIEKEHTNNNELAGKITRDHLVENFKYYTEPKLKNWGELEIKKEN